jgi:5-methyltetrahydropteroyltriglutamate--homocysteine methyltransferase
MVVGSLPRPQWVQDVIVQRTQGVLSAGEADALLDDAIPMAVRMQECAGLDYVSDGEWRRENYARVFADKVGGFRRQEVQRGPLALQAIVVDKMERRGDIVCRDAEFLRGLTNRKTIVALPSPSTVADLSWHPQHSTGAYPTREHCARDCVPILRDEVIALSRLGVEAIQLDEPLLSRLKDPQLYGLEPSRQALEATASLAVETANEIFDGLDDLYLTVHLCHGYGDDSGIAEEIDHIMMDAASRMRADRLAMEFNSPAAARLQPLRNFPTDKMLGLGIVNPGASSGPETVEVMIERVERALEFVEPRRLTLNPDCGFATTVDGAYGFDVAYEKLAAMCRAAVSLRKKYS